MLDSRHSIAKSPVTDADEKCDALRRFRCKLRGLRRQSVGIDLSRVQFRHQDMPSRLHVIRLGTKSQRAALVTFPKTPSPLFQ
jgi:hypothetical protein